MATFLTSRPFGGIRQAKYEQLLEKNPDWIRGATRQEVEDYLKKVERRFVDRMGELIPGMEKQLGCGQELMREDWAENFSRLQQAQEMAREVAWREAMEL